VETEPAATRPVTLGTVGEWGQLEMLPIVISPPLELVPTNLDPIPPRAQWLFPKATAAELRAWLSDAGFPRDQLDPLLAGAQPMPRIEGLLLSPEWSVVKSLPPQVRSRIYVALASVDLNQAQANAARFYGTADEWLSNSLVSPRSLEIVRPLIYADGAFQLFADTEVARAEIGDPQEVRRLDKMMLRDKTLVVRLRVPDRSKLDQVIGYWGFGGRRTDIRPLLESMAVLGPDASVDVAHLLPPFARQHLYRYPQVTLEDLAKPSLVNCFWTAMNFFNAAPYDERFLDLNFTMARLRRDYYLVHDQFQLGDLVVFYDAGGMPYHAAVYLADGLVFGKNGSSPLAPWTIMPLDRVAGYFPASAAGRMGYYRGSGL
jgi:hypothetical protein